MIRTKNKLFLLFLLVQQSFIKRCSAWTVNFLQDSAIPVSFWPVAGKMVANLHGTLNLFGTYKAKNRRQVPAPKGLRKLHRRKRDSKKEGWVSKSNREV